MKMKNFNAPKVIFNKECNVKPLKIKFKTQQLGSKCTLKLENFHDMLKNFYGVERQTAYIFF